MVGQVLDFVGQMRSDPQQAFTLLDAAGRSRKTEPGSEGSPPAAISCQRPSLLNSASRAAWKGATSEAGGR